MSSDRPRQLDSLDVNEAKDGLIVYDPVSDRVHHLNATAAVIFSCCDGEHDAASMASVVAAAFRLEQLPIDEVQACLKEFVVNGLVE